MKSTDISDRTIDSPCPHDNHCRCGIRYSVETQQLLNEIIGLMQGRADKAVIQQKFEVFKERLRRRFLEKYQDAARAEQEVMVDDKVVLIQTFLRGDSDAAVITV